jgi:mannose-6-phosphate isomerase-like protein (cupin superfamily)
MITADIKKVEGRKYPAGRLTKQIAGGSSDIKPDNFCMGFVMLNPKGGQVPWHAHDNEEVYFILSGVGEAVVGDEIKIMRSGEAVYISSGIYHQITNISGIALKMIYCYAPAGEVSHWKEELADTLPRAGIEAPSLPKGASPQFIKGKKPRRKRSG